MAHRHGHAHHLVPRQDGVKTVVNVVIKTMPKTFDGDAIWVTQAPKTLIDPAVRDPTSTADRPASSAKANPTSVNTAEITATSSPRKTASTLMVATSSPTVAGAIVAATSSIGLPSSTPTESAQAAQSTTSSGMSGGAKAGLALGILCAVGALLVGILFLYRRKKNQARQQQSINDEKSAMQNALPPLPPVVEPAPSIRTQRTMSTAPRLSLRPVTQFSPTFENRKSGGNLLTAAAAGAPAPYTPDQALSPQQPSSPWERPGATNAAVAPQNPFNDPVSRSNSPPQNPFETSPINDVPQEAGFNDPRAVPQTLAPAGPPQDFANPAPAIAAATAAAAAIPMAMATTAPRNDLPAPPSINGDMVPPSPAWTDDIPASPGPAPTGPPPIAVAGGSANGPAPAPPNNVHRVQLDFKPSMHDELELRAGQLVRMLHEYDDGWALCIRMDRSQQGVVPRTCLSKHPVKPRTGPPRQGPPGPPRARGPPMGSPMGPGGIPRPLTPGSRPSSPHPPSLSPANGRMSPAPRSMSPGPRAMSPGPRNMPPGPPRSMSPGPRNMPPPGMRARSNSTAPYAGPPRSMSPGPYGGGPQQHMPPPQMGRPRSNSASQVMVRRASPPGPSPMNPNGNVAVAPMPARKPVPGMAL